MEDNFNNSTLKSTMSGTKEIEKFYYATKNALEQQPNSEFWKNAYHFIEEKFNKIKTPKPLNKVGPFI